MKTQNKYLYFLFGIIMALFSGAVLLSCGNDDPTLSELREDKLQFLKDSLRISDSLRQVNAAGVVNYGLAIINGATSSIYHNAKTEATQSAVDGAIVTISQFGKTLKDTTDASGIVVFKGFFRSTATVTVQKADFTPVSYIAQLNVQRDTAYITFVGNMIPIFPTTGAQTANVSGRVTIQSDLTNSTRELAPDGTTISYAIDAQAPAFANEFLTQALEGQGIFTASCGCKFVLVGGVLQASYGTGILATTAAGLYSVAIPAAIDELPLTIIYSDIAATQTLFESAAEGQRTITNRTVYVAGSTSSAVLPSSSTATVSFVSFETAATATAVISANAGTVDRINVTAGGTGYISGTPPLVEITGGGGTGATATATVGANGRVTAITLGSPGSGYTSAPTVTIVSGGVSATANTVLDANNQQVFSIQVTAQGTGYTTAPTIGFTGGGGTGASAVAQVANGRLVAIIVTATGSTYTAAPAVTITGGGGAGATATPQMGSALAQVNMTAAGSNHVYTPVVTIGPPNFSNGSQATGQAVFDPSTRTILGVLITNAGSGYTSPPSITINGGSGASAQSFLTGGSVISANVTAQGVNYAYAPTVVIGGVTSGGGTGATGTAVMSAGKVIGINITSGGTGYTAIPDIALVVGGSANASASVVNGVITAITVTDGGSNFAGEPRVVIASTDGGGATATATVAGGQITGVTVTTGGTGYIVGNTPAAAEPFSATRTTLNARPGIKYINDVHYGTGTTRHPN